MGSRPRSATDWSAVSTIQTSCVLQHGAQCTAVRRKRAAYVVCMYFIVRRWARAGRSEHVDRAAQNSGPNRKNRRRPRAGWPAECQSGHPESFESSKSRTAGAGDDQPRQPARRSTYRACTHSGCSSAGGLCGRRRARTAAVHSGTGFYRRGFLRSCGVRRRRGHTARPVQSCRTSRR